MPYIPVDFSQLDFVFGGAGLPFGAVCTMGFNHPNGTTPLDALDVIEPLMQDLVEATCVEGVSLVELRVKQGPPATGASGARSVDIPGDQSTDAPPTQTALNVRKTTALGGRANRGRMFWPGYPESVLLVGGSFDQSALDQFNAAFETFREDMDTANYTLVLLHTEQGNTPEVITNLSVGSRPITIRARNRPR